MYVWTAFIPPQMGQRLICAFGATPHSVIIIRGVIDRRTESSHPPAEYIYMRLGYVYTRFWYVYIRFYMFICVSNIFMCVFVQICTISLNFNCFARCGACLRRFGDLRKTWSWILKACHINENTDLYTFWNVILQIVHPPLTPSNRPCASPPVCPSGGW